MRIMVLGGVGLLGRALVKAMLDQDDLEIYATKHAANPTLIKSRVRYIKCDALNPDELKDLFQKVQPHAVINCIAPKRTHLHAMNALTIIPLCSLLPHILQAFCVKFNSRLIHISTDAVFSGKRGLYTENEIPDPIDLYGRAKLLGEVTDINSITLRTSMIGHEDGAGGGLLDWLLVQKGVCKGYRKAIFSGMPSCILAKVIINKILPNSDLYGVYNLASPPISKYDLLNLVVNTYHLPIDVCPDDSLIINRSLSPLKFKEATGFIPLSWENMIVTMYADYMDNMA
jgi:dTDP-4-dehydrorhamnose reductase